jgi:prepilin-type N-terminal cleavage/methylation domain-containing protein
VTGGGNHDRSGRRPSAAARRGFTLIEIMVSIMIFLVVGGAMLGILLLASNLYRQGEAARSANDEAVAVLADLDADLARAIPPGDGGILYADVHDASGNTLLAFTTAARDTTTMDHSGLGARTIVVWWVDGKNNLRRAERAEPPDNDPAIDEDMNEMIDMISGATALTWPIITTGCLHFGVSLSLDGDPRTSTRDWSSRSSSEYPTAAASYYHGTDPYPRSLLATVALTGGGRFATTGFVVSDDGASIRIAGIKGLPTLPGSMVRIEDEWIGYNGYANGTLSCPTVPAQPLVGRGQRRSTVAAHPGAGPARATVVLAQTYSLVRDLAQ